MERRGILKSIVLAMAGAAASSPDAAAAPQASAPKIIDHLTDLDKATFVLGNIANDYKGMGGADKVESRCAEGASLTTFPSVQQ